jgi:RNA polymerase sigma-70 factor, ECF subfamily
VATQRSAANPPPIALRFPFMTPAGNSTGLPSGDENDESALVAQVQQGSGAAYATLVHRHISRAHRIAWRVLRHREEAEDAVQDAFLRALEKIDQCDPARGFAPWFFRIVATTAINRQRSARLRETDELSDTTFSGGIAPDVSASERALRDAIAAAMDRLPDMQRQLMVLVTFEEFTPTEAADAVGIPAGTARWHIHEARKALRVQLQSWLADGDAA